MNRWTWPFSGITVLGPTFLTNGLLELSRLVASQKGNPPKPTTCTVYESLRAACATSCQPQHSGTSDIDTQNEHVMLVQNGMHAGIYFFHGLDESCLCLLFLVTDEALKRGNSAVLCRGVHRFSCRSGIQAPRETNKHPIHLN